MKNVEKKEYLFSLLSVVVVVVVVVGASSWLLYESSSARRLVAEAMMIIFARAAEKTGVEEDCNEKNPHVRTRNIKFN